MIKAENISKSFGFVKAVQDVSFEVGDGEILGFLGPNGAGKTTTMRILTGFLVADKGRVLIDGVNVNENPIDAQKKIGYLPENNPLYKDMQVAELLDLAADLSGVPKAKRKKAFDFVVKAVGIEQMYYRMAGELSKGYKQRVGIAMALVHDPKIIIMDEPTEGLDPNQRQEIRTLIKKLAKNRTIILSTHVMQEASAICDRMLVISNGKIVADGTADKLSADFGGERILIFEAKGEKVASYIEKLEGVKSFEAEKEDGVVKAKIYSDKEVDLRPAISELIARRKWTVYKMFQQEHKLEDIFQKLTIKE